MKMLVVGIDALTMSLLTKEAFPIIEDFKFRTINSTIPYITPPAWTTAWTGLNPSHHGIFGMISLSECDEPEGIFSKFWSRWNRDYLYMRDMPRFNKYRIWDYLSQRGLKCRVFDMPLSLPTFDSGAEVIIPCQIEPLQAFVYGSITIPMRGELPGISLQKLKRKMGFKNYKKYGKLADSMMKIDYKARIISPPTMEDDVDVLFIGFPELDRAAHHFGIDHEYTIELLRRISRTIERFSAFSTIIFSDHGYESYTRILNINRFLENNQFCILEDGRVDASRSAAYPTSFRFPRRSGTQEYGIFVNSRRRGGIVRENNVERLKTRIIEELIKIPDVAAYSNEVYYDVEGEYFDEAPDVVFESQNAGTYFVSSAKNPEEMRDTTNAFHSKKAVFGVNFPTDFTVTSLEEIYGFICKYLDVEHGHIVKDSNFVFADYDETKVISRLKDLGYL